jgi:hypothetical protein
VIEAGKQLGLEYCEDVNDLPPGHTDCISRCRSYGDSLLIRPSLEEELHVHGLDGHREPEPPDARLSNANAGINRYSGELHSISIIMPRVAKKSKAAE